MKILLVEDDFDVAKNVCEYLEANKHEVEVAPDPQGPLVARVFKAMTA